MWGFPFFFFFFSFGGKGGICCFGVMYVLADFVFFIWLGWGSLLFHMPYQKVFSFYLYG